jgi:hypothetical protein
MFWLQSASRIHYVWEFAGIEKWKILQQNFGKTG